MSTIVKESRRTAVRMSVVLVFLLGMPLLALPRVQDALSDTDTPIAIDDQPASAPEAPLLRVESPVKLDPKETPAEPSMMPGASGDKLLEKQLAQLRQRLVSLGATYVRLERIGMDGERYRCTCHIPVAVGSPYREEVHAVAPDPLQAMTEVLADIAARSASPSDGVLPRPTVTLR